ncbi:hypothetical protein GCM10027341_55890 [Spirosoma knui]
MNRLSTRLIKSLDWTVYTIAFFRNHFLVIFGLGFIAAVGRAIQLNAFGPISSELNIGLEIIVESARILLFVYALGLTNIRAGIARLVRFVTNRQRRKQSWRLSLQTMRKNWLAILVNLCVFSVLAFLMNAFIDHIAYETCLYITLKARQLISAQASEWVLILFFKNLSVIPFTLLFNAVFCLWLVNRLPKPVAYS